SRAPSVKLWSQWLPGSRNSKRAGRYFRLGCLALAALARCPPQETPRAHWSGREAGSARQYLQRRCPPGEAGRDTPFALQLSLQHSSSQLHALPRAPAPPRDSTLLDVGGAEVSLRLPDGDSHPVATQGGAVEPTPPSQKSARRSHVKIMSSIVSRFSQAPHSYVLTPVPDGAVPRHACATPPAMHTVQSHPPFFFKTMRGQPQISSPSLGGAGAYLGVDSLTMSRLVPDQFNSKPSLAGCAASWRACAVSPLVLRTITAGYVLQFAPSPSAIRRSDPISGAAGAVSFSTERDSLPAQKRSDKHRPILDLR